MTKWQKLIKEECECFYLERNRKRLQEIGKKRNRGVKECHRAKNSKNQLGGSEEDIQKDEDWKDKWRQVVLTTYLWRYGSVQE